MTGENLLGIPGMTPGGIGIWSLLSVCIVALIRAWPLLAAQAIKAREQIRAEKSDDLDDMRKRMGDLETKVEQASSAAHQAEMKLVYAISAVQLLATRIRADNPNDPTLVQAMELLAAATSGGMPGWAGPLAAQLGKIKGTGE